ncbi:hypothetical protein [Bacteroides caecigallinarum]|uniref:hypothetical protein n=1 Tax=Bacteroides caecigallinarum TaxID=1411144 RepID=UPI001959D05F|nr:hypothetical protein [Bacteroides caecigallinarum]MBM6883575.1 hypothetical protein [Bacteroides caecigallinarum]
MGKLALKIYKALYGLDIEAQSTELTRLRLENKRLSELLRSTSREYNALNDKYKKKKESLSNEYGVVSDEFNKLKEKYETLVMEKENLENTLKENSEKFKEETDRISLESEKMSGEIESLQKVIEGLNAEKDTIEKEKETLCKEKETLGTEKENLAKELEAINKEKVTLNSEKEAASKELESIKERYLAEKDSLSKELKSLNELHITEKDSLNKEIISLRKEITSLQELYYKGKEENTILSEKIKSLESEITNSNITVNTAEEVSSINEEKKEEVQTAETTSDKKAVENTNDEELIKERMQKEIVSLTHKYDYIRVTTTIGNQYLYQSKHFQLRTGLFDWGIEGKEIITDEILYIENSSVAKMEGLDSPFDGEEIACNFEDEDSASAVADSLLMAICTYQPIQVNYHDKNGRTTLKNLYHVTFKPLTNKFSLPYKNLFRDMLDDKIDAEQLSALCPHNPEPRNFVIQQIQTLRRFNAFFTTSKGIETLKEGIKLAQDAEQTELAEVLMSKIQN